MSKLDLSPAKWIWLPVERTLANTAVIFRRTVHLERIPSDVHGWVFADSRYELWVNNARVQWGPAPADPRWPEVDPLNLDTYLRVGANLIEVKVLWFGQGEGTYVPSNPGFICRVDADGMAGGLLATDLTWEVALDRTLKPGGHAQSMLRALQEIRDLRETCGRSWMRAVELPIPANKPLICGKPQPGGAHCLETGDKFLRSRMIPLMREEMHTDFELFERGTIQWRVPVEDWFDFRVADAIECHPGAVENEPIAKGVQGMGAYLSFAMPEIRAGWPEIEIEAPEGTVIEVIYQESHDPDNGPWLDTMHFAWSRFTCRNGINRLRPFDWYSMRYLQLHIRENEGPVTVKAVRFHRRVYPFAREPQFDCSERPLQRLFEANVNTLRNSIQECNTDGPGRERQQYAGDCSYQQTPLRMLFGESQHGERFLRTFADGQTFDGYFLDTWPANDRMIRIGQRLIGMTPWGPILDHGVGFVIDCWQHWMESGREVRVRELLPHLQRFARYLANRRDGNGLIPAEHELQGMTSVWMDHDAYGSPAQGRDKTNDASAITQRRKTGSFNLYTAGMLRHALVPLCRAFGSETEAAEFASLAEEFEVAVDARYWCSELGLYVDNLPWAKEEGVLHCSDRTLAMSALYGYLPKASQPLVASLLAGESVAGIEVGWSYIVNAVWRHRALFQLGRVDAALCLLREQWARFPSIESGNTLPEHWHFLPDSKDLWSHCAVVPLIDLVEGIAGLFPAEPGFATVGLRPALADLTALELTVRLPIGALHVQVGPSGITYHFPEAMRWRLELPNGSSEGKGNYLFVGRAHAWD